MTGKSLLPPNASKHERDIEAVISPPLSFPNRDIWNSEKCPEHLLPHLAWALSVDNWDSSWPVERKRQVIKDSIYIHRKKGTRDAVEKTLDVVRGDQVSITEWFEDKGNLAPGEFDINYLSTNQPIDASDLHALVPSIEAAKNVRSTLKRITITSQSSLIQRYGTLSRIGIDAKSGPWLVKSVALSSTNLLACLSRQAIWVRSGPRPILLE